jgi:diaminobutyrate-2-oxoglutarate transaminase
MEAIPMLIDTRELDIAIFEERESQVRSYCRSFPAVFTRAKGALLYAEDHRAYIDFFAGAGALNYGHNNDRIKQQLIAYLESDQIAHGLDMYTSAKRAFLERFSEIILKPRGLDYKVQFCGPTGANAVEAALKLARKITGRSGVFSFMGGYHGLSLGSLANSSFMPYPYGFMATIDSLRYIEAVLTDEHSGIDKPAAMVVETIQAEGGIIVAPTEWLQGLSKLCQKHGILLICDDIQVGCGRTGSFFSFERAAIQPDLVTLSKSISGYGLPMALLLIRPELDAWQPAEHTGTFRGNQLAFVGASAALEYWQSPALSEHISAAESLIASFLADEILPLDRRIAVRGMGLIWGIDLSGLDDPEAARQIATRCFEHGLIIERVGRRDSVLKILPPLTIDHELLLRGCAIIKQSILEYMDEKQQR